jgi:hypothetical protein
MSDSNLKKGIALFQARPKGRSGSPRDQDISRCMHGAILRGGSTPIHTGITTFHPGMIPLSHLRLA